MDTLMYIELFKRFFKEHRGKVLLYILVTAAALPLESIGFSRYTSRIIGFAKQRGGLQYEKIYRCIFMIAVIYLSTRVLAMIDTYLEALIDNHLIKTVRSHMFETYLKQYKTNYVEVGPGKITSYFSVIPKMYLDIMSRTLSRILPYSLAILFIVGYFFTVDFRLGGIFVGLIISLVGAFYITLQNCIAMNIERQNSSYKKNEHIADRMANLFSILVNNGDKDEVKTNDDLEETHRRQAYKADMGYLRVETTINVILFVFMMAVLALYLHLFRTRPKSPTVLASFLVVFYLISYIDRIKWHFVDVINKIAIIKSHEATDFSQSIDNTNTLGKGTQRDFITDGHIVAENIGFSYGPKVIHEDLSIEFVPNKVHLLKGHSGRGKTTLIKIILGFHAIDSGKVYIDGVDLYDADIDYVRDNLSVVNQDARLFNNTVLYNIQYGNNASYEEVVEWIDHLGLWDSVFSHMSRELDNIVGVNGANVSNGQRQVILILRAFLDRRKILILDEPTAALDVETTDIVLDMIREISEGRTTIIITHDDLGIDAEVHEI